MEPTAGLAEAGQSSSLVKRYFTSADTPVFETVEWEIRDAWTPDSPYYRPDLRVPTTWSQNALNIVSKLYLANASDYVENGVDELIRRVASFYAIEAVQDGYFPGLTVPHRYGTYDQATNRLVIDTPADRIKTLEMYDVGDAVRIFYDELCFMLLHQLVAFNSPVWFNVGRPDRQPQISACFILGVDDNTPSLQATAKREVDIFRGGSGSGMDVSRIRGSMEPLSTGGIASGPVSFMRWWDAGAGTFKSGGTTRRAAKLVKLDADHPDIIDFVQCKVREEEHLKILAAAGLNIGFDMEGERNVAEVTSFQNANNSVGATDAFMHLATSDQEAIWYLISRVDGETTDAVDPSELLDKISQAAWECADPGMLFMDTINRMHTTPMIDGEASPIRSSNPCLTGETLIDTAEGRIRIDELARRSAAGEGLPLVFSWDTTTNLPVLAHASRAWQTKTTTDFIEIVTDKGVRIECTPEHRFLLKDGRYVEAMELVRGDRLRKIGRWANERRSSRRNINHRTTETAPNGTVIQARFMWEQAYGPIPEGMDVHHVNDDPTDDRLSNFELVPAGEHQSHHSSGSNNGRFIEVSDEQLVEIYDEVMEAKGAVTPARWNAYIDENDLKGIIPKAASPTREGRIQGKTWIEFLEFVADSKALVNDVISEIRWVRYDVPEPVFDMSVPQTQNFAVATEGVEHTVVVHNCGEYLSNDDTSCNLASINVLALLDDAGHPHIGNLRQIVDVMTVAMDASVSFGYFPDPIISDRSKKLRQLGLGYSNMGAAILAKGLAYDSDEARDFAASITALITGRGYRKSAELASVVGAFHYYDENRDAMLDVIQRHIDALPHEYEDGSVWAHATRDWVSGQREGLTRGYRNAQMSVIAPAGTISFLMDCDTTGVEPAFQLVSHKQLAGGGSMVLEVKAVKRALETLGYSPEGVQNILAFLRRYERVPTTLDYDPDDGEGYVVVEKDLPVFATAGDISWQGHVKMLAAAQPFVSGSISKTINMPHEATADDVQDAYVMAWRAGVKDISIYRDGSKARQVLGGKPKEEVKEILAEEDERDISEAAVEAMMIALKEQRIVDLRSPQQQRVHDEAAKRLDLESERKRQDARNLEQAVAEPYRRRMPRTRDMRAHKIHVRGALAEHEGYVMAGVHPDGTLGELFIEGFGKQGSFTQNSLSAWATAFSIALQYGVPMEVLCRKHAFVTDETGGIVVPDRDGTPLVIRKCDSIIDYIARWLVAEFGDVDLQEELGVMTDAVKARKAESFAPPAAYLTGEAAQLSGLIQSQGSPAGPVHAGPGHSHDNKPPMIQAIGPACSTCSTPMQRTGACFTCPGCGATTGCG